jgi:hypothetical protein
MSDRENEIKDLQNNAAYLEEAMFNCYLIFTEQLTVGDLEQELGFWLPEPTDTIISDVLKFFEEKEDYEKCKDIKEQVDKIGDKELLEKVYTIERYNNL